ncbi:MAG: hypothetical protein FJY20_12335 [Bacteroidetes bacterium]|nr:hypothetical protein [Bacteroidota bacterium]
MKKHISILGLTLAAATSVFSQQTRFSIATDLSVQHNFKKEQRFTVIGHTVQVQVHLTPKEGIYVWFVYYSNGKFKNNLTATAKSPVTVPQQINYVNSANMRLKQFSIGWKKYLIGNAEAEKGINIYAHAGFGLLLGRIENTHSTGINTADYNVPVISGRANFKRLTIDPGLGVEKHLGSDIFLYGEARVWIPTDGYPSRYIYINDRAPWAGMLSAGLRVLF